MGATKDFFREKKGWSVLKDSIFDYYLKPYLSKILSTKKPLYIYDCFAGKGKFDDGTRGSPLIIADNIKKVIESESHSFKDIMGYFIESKYFQELNHNLSDCIKCNVLEGTYEQHVECNLLTLRDTKINLFLYIDPYGIKSLNFDYFRRIKGKGFSSVELLMNFNSFGFLREGTRLLKCEEEFCSFEEDFLYELDDKNSIERMNSIVDGTYWQKIIGDTIGGKISITDAEENLVEEYTNRLKNLFKFTVNIPIKEKKSHLPKYRLIFGTDHQDGLILMSDKMNKAWNEFLEDQRAGQKVFDFEYDFPDMVSCRGYDIEEDILLMIKNSETILLKDLIVELVMKYGISFPEKYYKDKILSMENQDKISIFRTPNTTPTGKTARTMNYNDKRYKIYVRLKKDE